MNGYKCGLWGVMVFFVTAFAVFAEPPVKIVVDEWPPYLSKDLKHYGIAAHIVEEAFKNKKVGVEVTFVPWKRVLYDIKEGIYDASILWVRTEERARDFYFSDIVIEGQAVFFHLKDFDFKWDGYRDLVGLQIGALITASYPWVEKAREQNITLSLQPVRSEQQNFGKLLMGRIQVYAMDRLVGYSILRTYFEKQMDRITYNPKPVETWPYRLIFSKRLQRSPHLVDLFNQGLKIVQQQGLIEQYLKDFHHKRNQR